jgi:hypothetical protein
VFGNGHAFYSHPIFKGADEGHEGFRNDSFGFLNFVLFATFVVNINVKIAAHKESL